MRNEAGYWDATSGGTQYYRNDGTSARAWNKDVTSATLYARWTANQSYTITYDANAGSDKVDKMPNPLSETTTAGVPYYISNNKPERDGYVFNGWKPSNTAVGFSAVSALITPRYWLGQLFTATANTTMKAQWVAERYEVKYDANGGSGAPDPDWQEHDKALTLATKKPSRNGFRFIGWALSSSAVVPEIDGGVLRRQNAPTTVYAVWQKRIEIRVNNAFDSGYMMNYYGKTDMDGYDGAVSAIRGYRNGVAMQFSILLNVHLTGNDAMGFVSAVDECKGKVTSANLNTLCKDKSPPCNMNHTNHPVLRDHFMRNTRGNAGIKNVLWSAHEITTGDSTNRSFADSINGTSVFILNKEFVDRASDSRSILMHELAHMIGAPDHYHDLSDSGSGCGRTKICSEWWCKDKKEQRPYNCLMFNSKQDITNERIFCAECTKDIHTQLRTYWVR